MILLGLTFHANLSLCLVDKSAVFHSLVASVFGFFVFGTFGREAFRFPPLLEAGMVCDSVPDADGSQVSTEAMPDSAPVCGDRLKEKY